MSDLRIGCSGWAYKDWRGPFYPSEVKVKDHLAYYASRFSTAEINASFYRLPTEKAVKGWHDAVSDGFLFAWKASRFVTHIKRLKDVHDSLDLIFDRMAPLGDRFGPVLFQLPPSMKADRERLADFLKLLPKGRRCTVEFRHPSWYAPDIFRLLGDHDVSLCLSDHHHAPAPWEATASWVYVRAHGPGGRYYGRYPDKDLKALAERIKAWRKGRHDVYAYFDNDIKSAAPKDAGRLVDLAANP